MGLSSSARTPGGRIHSPLRRTLTNTAWLLGGKAFSTLCGLGYLAFLTRSLGIEGTGHFAVILGAAQGLVAVTGFQTWRVVIRYGAKHVHAADWAAFGRLGLLCGVFDAMGAAIGCVVAGVAIYGFGGALGLEPKYADPAFAFCCTMLWAVAYAPTGIVRALHRFDTGAYVEAIVPVGRLVAAAAIWWTGPSVNRFLFAWAMIALAQGAGYWVMARRLCPEAVKLSHLAHWRDAFRENPGVGRFLVITNISSTLEAIRRFGPLLAVGGLIGVASAGLYSVASQLSEPLSKLSALLTRAVYAEVASVRAASTAAALRKFVAQTSAIAGLAGLIVVAFALLAAKPVLVILSGPAFAQAAPILLPLAVAASFELGSIAFEPALHLTDRAVHALAVRALALLILSAAAYVLIGQGPTGIAWAGAAGAAGGYIAMGVMAARTLRRMPQAADQPVSIDVPTMSST